MMVTERCLEKVGGRGKRKHGESRGAAIEWRVLENGVLAVKTPLEVVTTEGEVWEVHLDESSLPTKGALSFGQYELMNLTKES